MTPIIRTEIENLFIQFKREWQSSSELDQHCLLKTHYLIEHSLDFIKANGDYLLGLWSEQEYESVHRCFLTVFNHYSEDNLLATRLERAIGLFNAVRFSPP